MNIKPSARSIQWLFSELEKWLGDDLITREQSDAIRALYPMQGGTKSISAKFVAIFLVIGALILGAGIILFIASNWSAIPGWVKISATLCLIIASNISGIILAYGKGKHQFLGEALLFLGSMLFGAGIWVIAQVFNFNARYTDGALFWFAGIIPVAWILRKTQIIVLSSVILSVWALWEAIAYNGPVIAYPFLMAALIVPLVYLRNTKLGLVTVIAGTILWMGFGLFREFLQGGNLVRWIILYFPQAIVLYCLGIYHSANKKYRSFEAIYRASGLFILLTLLYAGSFKSVEDWSSIVFDAPLATGIGTGISVSALALTAFFSGKLKPMDPSDSKIVIGERISLIIIGLFPILAAINKFAIAANIILFALTLGLIYTGFQKKNKLILNSGFILFAILFITRFIDFGWMYADRALFFIIAGIIVIGGGIALERARRYFIERITPQNKRRIP